MKRFSKAQKLLLAGLLLQLLSYALPFLDQPTGLEFFIHGLVKVASLLSRGARVDKLMIGYAVWLLH